MFRALSQSAYSPIAAKIREEVTSNEVTDRIERLYLDLVTSEAATHLSPSDRECRPRGAS